MNDPNISYLYSCSGVFFLSGVCFFLSPWMKIPFLGFEVAYLNEATFMRGFGGLYIGIALFWIYCTKTQENLTQVLLMSVFILLGDSAGKLLSVFFDGLPQFNILGAFFIQICLAGCGYYLYQKEKKEIKGKF